MKRYPTDIEFDGIDHADAPKFCDAFISVAVWSDTLEFLTEVELDELNSDSSFVHDALQSYLY